MTGRLKAKMYPAAKTTPGRATATIRARSSTARPTPPLPRERSRASTDPMVTVMTAQIRAISAEKRTGPLSPDTPSRPL